MPETTENYVDQSPFQFAKRELHRLLRSRSVWVGVCAAGVILGLAGPFGTEDHMRIAPRIAYWVLVALISFFSGAFVADLTAGLVGDRFVGKWGQLALVALAIAFTVFCEVIVLNWAVFGVSPMAPGYLGSLFLNVLAVSAVIAFSISVISKETEISQEVSGSPPILRRLELENRGTLLALSVSDHYVEVITSKGRELLLMRLSDAIQEAAPHAGLQVHRSHWVAISAIESVKKEGQRASITLKDGTMVPVSRARMPALRDAGVLPV